MQLTDDDLKLVIRALEQYYAYTRAMQREDARYKELAERLQRKPVAREEATEKPKRKKA